MIVDQGTEFRNKRIILMLSKALDQEDLMMEICQSFLISPKLINFPTLMKQILKSFLHQLKMKIIRENFCLKLPTWSHSLGANKVDIWWYLIDSPTFYLRELEWREDLKNSANKFSIFWSVQTVELNIEEYHLSLTDNGRFIQQVSSYNSWVSNKIDKLAFSNLLQNH